MTDDRGMAIISHTMGSLYQGLVTVVPGEAMTIETSQQGQ